MSSPNKSRSLTRNLSFKREKDVSKNKSLTRNFSFKRTREVSREVSIKSKSLTRNFSFKRSNINRVKVRRQFIIIKNYFEFGHKQQINEITAKQTFYVH